MVLGPAGAYNIAGDGVVSMSEVVAALGARPVRVPQFAAAAASAVVAQLPFAPSMLEWLHVVRTSVVDGHQQGKLGARPDAGIHLRGNTRYQVVSVTQAGQPA